jgi:hypothetical protein
VTTVDDTHPPPHQPGAQVKHRMINTGTGGRNAADRSPTTGHTLSDQQRLTSTRERRHLKADHRTRVCRVAQPPPAPSSATFVRAPSASSRGALVTAVAANPSRARNIAPGSLSVATGPTESAPLIAQGRRASDIRAVNAPDTRPTILNVSA